jgi:predicted RNA-binding protein with RPS1 domain
VTELPRFLIAKYVPDVFRNEPRNIGVVLWTPDGVAARFLGEKPDAPGEVDDADIPEFVNSKHAYKQWVRYWRRELGKPAVSQLGDLNSLRTHQPSTYEMTTGGVLSAALASGTRFECLTELFHRFVGSDEQQVADENEDPWEGDVVGRYKPGKMVRGTVTKLTGFGVFVELEPGLEGLLHISELSDSRIESPEDVVKVGDDVDVKVLRVDQTDRKIGLSMRNVYDPTVPDAIPDSPAEQDLVQRQGGEQDSRTPTHNELFVQK